MASFSDISRPKLNNRGNWSVSTILQNKCYPEETANCVACLSQNEWWDFEISRPDSPVSLFRYDCEGAETSIISRNQSRFALVRVLILCFRFDTLYVCVVSAPSYQGTS